MLLHDFAHYRFVSNKSVSDWVADLLLAWPVLATLEGYRRNHLGHHRYLNTDDDPDWKIKLGSREFTFPQEMRFAVLNLAGYLVGVSSIRDLRKALIRVRAQEKSTPAYKMLRLAYYVGVAVILTLIGGWTEFLLYWVVPYFSFFFMFMYVRSVADHFGPTMDYDHDLTSTRTVMPFFWEKWFFSPHHINFHIEHHLYASVPFYRLPELSRILMSNPAYAARAHITYGFVTGGGERWRSQARPGQTVHGACRLGAPHCAKRFLYDGSAQARGLSLRRPEFVRSRVSVLTDAVAVSRRLVQFVVGVSRRWRPAIRG